MKKEELWRELNKSENREKENGREEMKVTEKRSRECVRNMRGLGREGEEGAKRGKLRVIRGR